MFPFPFLVFVICILSHFPDHLTRGLSILLPFSKNQALDSLIFLYCLPTIFCAFFFFYFLLLTLDLIFLLHLRWKHRSFILDLSLLTQAFNAIHFPLGTALPAFHKIGMLCFHINSTHFLMSLVISVFIHGLFMHVLFNFPNIFWNF